MALRSELRELGILRVAKGRLTRTKAAARLQSDPVALFRYLAARTPPRRKDFERDAILAYLLAVAGSDPDPLERTATIMTALGWRPEGGGQYFPIHAGSHTYGTRALMDRMGGLEERPIEGSYRTEWTVTDVGRAFAQAVIVPKPQTTVADL